MLLAHNILLDVKLEDAVVGGDLGTRVKLHTRRAHVLLTLHALGGRVPLARIYNLADIAVRYLRRLLGQHQLIQVADQEVVGQLAHAT